MVRTLSWNYRRRGIEMSLSSPWIAILFEHSEWFQPLFAGLDRRGIPYDRLLAAEEVELDLSPGHAGEDERPGAHVPVRDGHGAAADARGRGGHRQAHRARAAAGAEDDLALAHRD